MNFIGRRGITLSMFIWDQVMKMEVYIKQTLMGLSGGQVLNGAQTQLSTLGYASGIVQ
jgi:hypothetical protein